MSWHYQILRYPNGCYGLHEVYHTDEGVLWTNKAITFGADSEEGPEGVVKALEMALSDAKKRGVRDISADEGGDGADTAATR